MSKRGIGTRAVHGSRPPLHGPLTTPIVQSATFAFESSAEMRRYLAGDEELYLYTRYENPTLRELESRLAALEEGEAAVVFASGMAASTTGILSTVKAGDEVLAVLNPGDEPEVCALFTSVASPAGADGRIG